MDTNEVLWKQSVDLLSNITFHFVAEHGIDGMAKNVDILDNPGRLKFTCRCLVCGKEWDISLIDYADELGKLTPEFEGFWKFREDVINGNK